ncbi:hypothetical protein LTR28_000535 [Elasticomyces elasticus]|nr:hypothetical protein LTR28_000535 [Elasticomyces elasticus]
MSEQSPQPNGDAATDGDARDPSGFLSEIIGAPVTVKLNSGVVYKGSVRPPSCSPRQRKKTERIRGSDAYVPCDSTQHSSEREKEERKREGKRERRPLTQSTSTGDLQSVDGYMNIALERAKEYVDGEMKRNYGDAFVRGNNVMYIAADM